MAKFIDNNGFAHFLGKLKTLLDGKANASHNHAASDVNSGTFDAARIPNLGAGKITSGTLGAARLPTATTSAKGAVIVGSGLSISNGVLSADVQSVPNMVGITNDPDDSSLVAGSAGLVPAPTVNDDARVLTARAKWGTYGLSISETGNAFDGGLILLLYEYDSQNSAAVTQVATVQFPDASSSEKGLMSASDYQKLAALPTNSTLQSTYALKTDITSMYKHKGSVSAVGNLPSSGQTAGDVYNVTSTGMNYVWTGSEWDALGEVFSIDAMTTTEIDTAFSTAGLAVAS